MRDAAVLARDPKVETRPDGTIYISHRQELIDHHGTITERLVHFAGETPDAVFLADRLGEDSDWRRITYAETLEKVRRLGQALLDAGISAERPLAILSGNSIEHALLGLAAMHVGVAYAAISPAYALTGGDYARLRDTVEGVTPGMVYAADAGTFGPAVAAVMPDLPFVTRDGGAGSTPLADLLATEPTDAVDTAYAAVEDDTIAKFLFTSGSTGSPKAVPNTHGMLTSNQAMLRMGYAYFADEPPVILDWSPWHHTAGGNSVFLSVMMNGGTLYIDDGRPTKSEIGKTVRNLRDISPTWYFNVPTGYDALIPFLREDESLRATFFRDLKMLWYAGASLAQHTWDALEDLAVQATGHRILIATGLGATETSPGALYCTWPQDTAGNVGLPVPGVTLKLVPFEGKYDARVKGANVMPGYWRRPDLSQDCFDEEGFYKFGDALKPVDPDDITQGLAFDGRTAENFKLDTGTWVATGALRMKLIEHFGGALRDLAITGADRPYLGALVFPPEPEMAQDDAWRAQIRDGLSRFAAGATGSSNRVLRMLPVEEPLSLETGEMTDKGSVNQRRVLANRAELVEELYRGSDRVIEAERG
ncbi:feruloyl-CoA synthase [Mesobaculum littorinae]|uniref:Feruloyl-CoA synthase n=2 Tax=Mesobaculum littorinae TaxID=2486419 RepID=A0A438AHS7_9RHOB|nr:feruloyl-CoA synthase [Mesobaculum littorinae]